MSSSGGAGTAILVFIVLQIATALAVSSLGSTRRIGFWGALLASIVLTPVGGFLLALISGRKKHPPQKALPPGRA